MDNYSSKYQFWEKIVDRFIINGWTTFLIICAVYCLMLFILSSYIFTDYLYHESFSDKLTSQRIEYILNIQNRYRWLNYILIPLIVASKISYAAICISIGALLFNVEFKFKTVFKIVLLAEVIFLVGRAMYLINLSLHLDTLTLGTASNYYPLAILSYFGTENVVDWLQYPLQTINLFEVFYMMAIAWLISKQWKEDFMESLAIVVPSYATGLLLWPVLVTFLTLQVS